MQVLCAKLPLYFRSFHSTKFDSNLTLWRQATFGDFRKERPKRTWLCTGITLLLYGLPLSRLMVHICTTGIPFLSERPLLYHKCICFERYLCNTVTVNKHYHRPKKLWLFWKNYHFWQWLIEYSVVLI